MEALNGWLIELAHDTPVVVAGEDLHWSDPSTLELMRLLQRRLATAPVLIVVTRRLEGATSLAPDVEVELDRLDAEQTRTLARGLAAARGLHPDVADRVAERSDGVPLFVEELVAAAGENDDGGLPTSLQSSLLARLDRLGPARDVAQIASVLGRSFPERLLAAAADIPPYRLAGALRQLTAAGIVESRASVDGRRYEFRHALIRDAAYESLLRRSRVQLHRLVASVVEEQFPERARERARAARPPPRPRRRADASGRLLRGRRPPRARARPRWPRRPRTTGAGSSCSVGSSRAASATGARCGSASCSATR